MNKMITRTLFAIICVFIISNEIYSQSNDIINSGLIKATLTLSLSHKFEDESSPFYLHGSIEYYTKPTLSLSGEGYYYLGNLSEEVYIDYNHNLFFGISRHFIKNNNDFYIGLQPGISIFRSNYIENNIMESKGINPVFSTVIGYNLFVSNLFHFFIQTRYIAGNNNFTSSIYHTSDLSNIRLSAGLGFNLPQKHGTTSLITTCFIKIK